MRLATTTFVITTLCSVSTATAQQIIAQTSGLASPATR